MELAAQVFNPYRSPYTLPIPAIAEPNAVTTAPNLDYPQANDGGLMALADAETNFALRFSGESLEPPCLLSDLRSKGHSTSNRRHITWRAPAQADCLSQHVQVSLQGPHRVARDAIQRRP